MKHFINITLAILGIAILSLGILLIPDINKDSNKEAEISYLAAEMESSYNDQTANESTGTTEMNHTYTGIHADSSTNVHAHAHAYNTIQPLLKHDATLLDMVQETAPFTPYQTTMTTVQSNSGGMGVRLLKILPGAILDDFSDSEAF